MGAPLPGASGIRDWRTGVTECSGSLRRQIRKWWFYNEDRFLGIIFLFTFFSRDNVSLILHMDLCKMRLTEVKWLMQSHQPFKWRIKGVERDLSSTCSCPSPLPVGLWIERKTTSINRCAEMVIIGCSF